MHTQRLSRPAAHELHVALRRPAQALVGRSRTCACSPTSTACAIPRAHRRAGAAVRPRRVHEACRTASLSAGQRTRVSLAKALLNQPEVLLLDEPTASLDPDIGDRMRTYLEDYQRASRCTMLLASHNMGEVERMCDDVIMLRAGVVVDQGSPEDADRALRPRGHGGGVPRHRARHERRAGRGRRRREHHDLGRPVDMPAHPHVALHPQTGVAASARRVRAIVRRHAYLLLKSWPRMVSMMYYPTVTMILWAFITIYLRADDQLPAGRAGLLHRRGAAVGRPVPRPARRVADVHRGDVRAQPRQPVRGPAAPVRVHRRRSS